MLASKCGGGEGTPPPNVIRPRARFSQTGRKATSRGPYWAKPPTRPTRPTAPYWIIKKGGARHVKQAEGSFSKGENSGKRLGEKRHRYVVGSIERRLVEGLDTWVDLQNVNIIQKNYHNVSKPLAGLGAGFFLGVLLGPRVQGQASRPPTESPIMKTTAINSKMYFLTQTCTKKECSRLKRRGHHHHQTPTSPLEPPTKKYE